MSLLSLIGVWVSNVVTTQHRLHLRGQQGEKTNEVYGGNASKNSSILLAALPEELGSIPSTHVITRVCSLYSGEGILNDGKCNPLETKSNYRKV